MKRIGWMGWLVAGLVLLQNGAAVSAAPSGNDPLEGRLLQDSGGTSYVYHAGLKFTLQLAEMSDRVIGAIPTASPSQWDALLGGTPELKPALPPVNPEPWPGYP